ncbi:ABC1 kinase family protein [Ligilactobacillus equi]|uniref:ABC1 kinase family protein n=1 Tax=Ligilactobacillus equi TaxID=137357 RepID=UPI002ED21552
MTSKPEKLHRRTRLLQIVRVMRSYDVLGNFMHQKNPNQVKQAFEELGPTFIKVGQLLSTRPDLVSPAYLTTFAQLQDQVAVDDYHVVAQTFEEQTGKSISQVFANFEKEPFASGSIGQTHHATLQDGTAVVVKIQHPDVDQLVHTDFALFRMALKILRFVPEIGAVNPQEIFNEVRTSLLNEMDTRIEIENGDEFYHNNHGDGIIEVPKIYRKLSTQKILVNSAMPGQSISHLIKQPLSKNPKIAEEQQQLRHYFAHTLITNYLKQVFFDNFYHADPHPGNILFYELKPDNPHYQKKFTRPILNKQVGKHEFEFKKEELLPNYRLVYLDFGMMGRLSPDMVAGIARIIIALNTKDMYEIGNAILAVCKQTGPLDTDDFYSDLNIFLTPLLNMGLQHIDFPAMLYSIINLCKKNNLQMKSEITMLVKAFGSLEGIVAQLDPTISMLDVAQEFTTRYFQDKFKIRDFLAENGLAWGRLIKNLPYLGIKAQRSLDVINHGQLRLNIQLKGQNQIFDRIDHIVNRIIVALVLAAIFIGSSLLIEGSVNHPTIYRIGVFGYFFTFILIGILVLDSLIRRWRKWKRRK